MLVLATSVDPSNDGLAEHAKQRGTICFRGSEEDVLDRYYQAAKAFDFEHIVRATGDNPFVDYEEGQTLISHHLAGGYDYSCNFPSEGGLLPAGVGLEVFSFACLERSWRMGLAPHHREHVNEYVLENRRAFKFGIPKTPKCKQGPDLVMTVDTPQDFDWAQSMIVSWRAEGHADTPDTAWLIAQSK
jgi:spore coat polysaccharide biosynthesis protein SpsF